LPLPFTSTLVYYLLASLEPTKMGPLTGNHSNCRLLALAKILD
jgi:hypothetical protein